jgi:hypothetical protein
VRKLSKSDKLDKDEEARIRAQLFASKKSQHFAVGTYLLKPGGARGEILARHREWLTILWDDGSVAHERVLALVNNPH